jgi:predicted enzyme related to lactoylglutathione lyase
MINHRVSDLDGLLTALAEERVQIDPHRKDFDCGRFAWIMDPDGNRVGLWEPPKEK